jgi:hopene-associated glycosyltransferase HpnB
MLYPPAWILSSKRKTAGAAGGCILIRPEALRRIGGISAIRNQVIDDCALARAVKRKGGRVWLGLTRSTVSIRSYGSFAEIGRMIARTAFNQLQHSPLLLVGTVLGLFFTYLLPPILVLTRQPRLVSVGGAAWLLMSASYLPMVRFYKRSPLWSMALPGIALFYTGATVYSAFRYWRKRGGEWKGRIQDVAW